MQDYIGFQQALDLTLQHVPKIGIQRLPLADSSGLVAADRVAANADSPSIDVSMKDGYALRALDIAGTSKTRPVVLEVLGVQAAGQGNRYSARAGSAVRILTGAHIPQGFDTVVAEEFVTVSGNRIAIDQPVGKGRNILPRGSDVRDGEVVVTAGTVLTPGKIGILAAAGVASVRVFRRPQVALVATGDEIILPGETFSAGKIYASNLFTLNGWCHRYGLKCELKRVPDSVDELKAALQYSVEKNDAVVTSGGAWSGDRDVTARALEVLGWKKIYHRVRLGPGKAVGFGLLGQKPVFILPGGPPSNLVAFLLLVLPGLLRLSGHPDPGLPKGPAVVAETLEGESSWTQAVFGCISDSTGHIRFHPAKGNSRLKNMSTADALLLIPEGVSRLPAGASIEVRMLV